MIKVGWNSFLESMRSPGLSDPVSTLAEQNTAAERAVKELAAKEKLAALERSNLAKERELQARRGELLEKTKMFAELQ